MTGYLVVYEITSSRPLTDDRLTELADALLDITENDASTLDPDLAASIGGSAVDILAGKPLRARCASLLRTQTTRCLRAPDPDPNSGRARCPGRTRRTIGGDPQRPTTPPTAATGPRSCGGPGGAARSASTAYASRSLRV